MLRSKARVGAVQRFTLEWIVWNCSIGLEPGSFAIKCPNSPMIYPYRPLVFAIHSKPTGKMSLTSYSDHIFMASSCLQMLIHCSYSIVLHAFVVDNELDDPVPHFRTNMVAGSSYKLKDGIDVPLVLLVSLALPPSSNG